MPATAHHFSSASIASQLNVTSNSVGVTPGVVPTIELYTQPGCEYCLAAKKILTHKDFRYAEYDTSRNFRRLEIMKARAPGRAFPQVVINQQWIGDLDDLLASDLIRSA